MKQTMNIIDAMEENLQKKKPLALTSRTHSPISEARNDDIQTIQNIEERLSPSYGSAGSQVLSRLSSVQELGHLSASLSNSLNQTTIPELPRLPTKNHRRTQNFRKVMESKLPNDLQQGYDGYHNDLKLKIMNKVDTDKQGYGYYDVSHTIDRPLSGRDSIELQQHFQELNRKIMNQKKQINEMKTLNRNSPYRVRNFRSHLNPRWPQWFVIFVNACVMFCSSLHEHIYEQV